MKAYIAKQAVTDKSGADKAYEILYTDSETNDILSDDPDCSHAIDNFFSAIVNTDTEFDGKTVLFRFTRNLLIRNIPEMFDTNKLIIEVDDGLITNPSARQLFMRYKNAGYRIAVIDFGFNPKYFDVLDIVDYIKISFRDFKNESLESIVRICDSYGKKIIAYDINCKEAYDKALCYDCQLFEGSYVKKKIPCKTYNMNYLRENFFLLMIATTKDEPDIYEIEEILSHDVFLAYSILKLVNSSYFSGEYTAKSIRQAIIISGPRRLKQWIYLLSFRQDEECTDHEIMKLSLARAKFASEILDFCKEFMLSKSEGFSLGMFSMLDKLTGISENEMLSVIPVRSEVKKALSGRAGETGVLYELILSCESYDEKKVTEYSEKLGISPETAIESYEKVLMESNRIVNGFNTEYDIQ